MNAVAVYIRVSTEDQKLETQRGEIERWLASSPFAQESPRWYEDKLTGKNINRPGFRKLQAAIRKEQIDVVICWKLDRLSRNMLDGVQLIGDWMERGVRIISVTQNIDFSGLTGQIIASVLFAVAEMELNHIHERQAAGIAAAKAKGIYKGRKPGTTKGRPERAKQLRANGMLIAEIASALKVTERTVHSYLNQVES